jgi:GNAT superfamily N-acetyltransferase
VIVVALDASRIDAWAALVRASDSGCFCRYWHFTGDKNAWLARCVESPDENLRETSALVRASDPAARGLLALEADDAIGWMKLVPRAVVPKLRGQSVYRSLDLGPDEGVYAVGCFLVHPEHRQRGVARALLAAADEHVRAWGGLAIEAYPRRWPEPLRDDEAWQGPLALFAELGFTEVEDARATRQYPVYRKRVA